MNQALWVSRTWRAASVLMATCAVATGCATTHALPPDLDLARAAIVLDSSEPALALDGPPSKEVAVGVGAASGAGTGVLVAAVGCLGTGPFYAFCLTLVLPTTTAVGMLSGAVVGGMVSQDADVFEAKQGMLKTELAATSYPAMLAEELQKQAREQFLMDLPLLAVTAPATADPVSANADAPTWRIEVALTRVTNGRTAPNQAYFLRVEGSLKLRRASESSVVYETSEFATSEVPLTTAEWGADGAAAVQRGLEQSLRRLAGKLLGHLANSGAPWRLLAPVSFNGRGDS